MEVCPWCYTPVSSPGPCPQCGRAPQGPIVPDALFRGFLLEGRYRVGQALRRRAFDIAYLGWDTALERHVALWEYFPHRYVYRVPNGAVNTYDGGNSRDGFEAGMLEFVQRARRQEQWIADDTPAFPRVLDVLQTNGTAYVVAELPPAGTESLRCRVERLGPLSEQALLGSLPADELQRTLQRPAAEVKLAEQPLHPDELPLARVMIALYAMHKGGRGHFDIQPDTLLLRPDGTFMLADRGGLLPVSRDRYGELPPKMPHFSSAIYFEWARNDIYGLCASIYYGLTGQEPPGVTKIDEVPKESVLAPLKGKLSPERTELLLCGIGSHAHGHFPNMDSILMKFWPGVQPHIDPSPPPPPPPKAKKRKKAAGKDTTAYKGMLGALLCLALAAAFLGWREHVQSQQPSRAAIIAQMGSFREGDLLYTLTWEAETCTTVYVKEYLGDGGAVRFPAQVSGYEVVGIYPTGLRGAAFSECIFEDGFPSVSGLGVCPDLRSVTLGEGTKVSDSAFQDCAALEQLRFTGSGNQLGKLAFAGCTALEQVLLPDDCEYWSSTFPSGCLVTGGALLDPESKTGSTLLEQQLAGQG